MIRLVFIATDFFRHLYQVASTSKKTDEPHAGSPYTPRPSAAETDEWNQHGRLKINTVTIFYPETAVGMMLFIISVGERHVVHEVMPWKHRSRRHFCLTWKEYGWILRPSGLKPFWNKWSKRRCLTRQQ